jgi:hypothetical protein
MTGNSPKGVFSGGGDRALLLLDIGPGAFGVACRGAVTVRGSSSGFGDEKLKFLRWARLYI